MANERAEAQAKHTCIRNWFQAAWFALTNGYARGYTSGKIFTGNTKILCVPGLNCYSCPGALAACPIGSLQAVLNSSAYKVSLYVFGLLSMFGVLFGRLVCGWMCPFGLVQDLFYKIKVGGKKKNLPGHKYLRYLRFVVLAVMVIALPALVISENGVGQPWFCEWICPSGTLLGGIPLTLLNESFREIIGFRFFWKMFILVACCLGSIWYFRPFCKYLCPLGAIYGLFNPVSTYRLEIDPNKCIKCHACQRACGMDIATFETPNSIDCIRCGDCIKACPKGAIASTWGVTQQKIKSRCFIDDETVARAAVDQAPAAELPKQEKIIATIMGVLMTAGGAASAFLGLRFGVYSDFRMRMSIEALASVMPGSFVYECFKVLASCIVFATGIYVLRYRADGERLKTVSEKMRIAFLTYLLCIVSLVVSVFINFTTISLSTNNIVYNFFPLLGIPMLWAASAALRKRIQEGKFKALTVVLLVLVAVVTILAVILALVFIFTE